MKFSKQKTNIVCSFDKMLIKFWKMNWLNNVI